MIAAEPQAAACMLLRTRAAAQVDPLRAVPVALFVDRGFEVLSAYRSGAARGGRREWEEPVPSVVGADGTGEPFDPFDRAPRGAGSFSVRLGDQKP